jgi:hypothetical protein
LTKELFAADLPSPQPQSEPQEEDFVEKDFAFFKMFFPI